MHTATADVILTSPPHCLTVSFTSGLSSTAEETWCQTQALLAVRGSQAFTSPTANVPGVSPWVTWPATCLNADSFLAQSLVSDSSAIWCPGPGGKRGHALLPHFWHGGWLTMPLWLSGCLQRSFQLGAKTGSLLWNFQAWGSYFNYKHHDAGDGVWWRDAGQRICGLFQWNQTLHWWYVVIFLVAFPLLDLFKIIQIHPACMCLNHTTRYTGLKKKNYKKIAKTCAIS